MASNKNTRQISIFIDSKGADNSLKSLTTESRKLSNELALMDRTAADYPETLKKLQTVKGYIEDHKKSLSGVKQGWSMLKGGIGDFIGVAAGAFAVDSLLGYGKQLFGVSLQLDTVERKARTVFGDVFPKVAAAAAENAAAMGLTNSQYIAAAANIQDLLVPMGFQRDKAQEISTQLVNLSGALSEWSGGTRSAIEVSEILNKALLGEREELKGLGISISEADVQAQLGAKGLDKLTGKALEQAEALSTLELILAKSTDAQTQFADGSNTAIRSQAEAAAKIQNIVEKISSALLPVFSKLIELAGTAADALGFIIDPMAETEKASASLAEQTKRTQAEFNSEIEVLTKGNFTQEERAKLIAEINSKYHEYLPNLISEKAGIDEITAAQAAANKVFSQKIIYQSYQEEITKATKKAADAITAAYEAEKKRQELVQSQSVPNPQTADNVNADKVLQSQINLLGSIRDEAQQTAKAAPEIANNIRQIYGQLAAGMGASLAELEKSFGGIEKTAGGNTGNEKRSKKDDPGEDEKTIIARFKRSKEISERLTAITQKEAERQTEIFKAEQERQLDDYGKHKEATALVDINYEQERQEIEARIKTQLQSNIESELEAVKSKYGELILLAEKYGIDLSDLKVRQAEDEKAILEEIRGGAEAGTFGAFESELETKRSQLEQYYEAQIEAAKAAGKSTVEIEKEWQDESFALTMQFATKKLELFASSFEGISASYMEAFAVFSDNESDFVAFQKSLAIAQIAIDTATAISGIVAAAASTSITPIDLAIKITAGIGLVLANIAKAKKLLDTPLPVKQKFEGGYLSVTGETDGRAYNAALIPPPDTGFLPHHPVIFQSQATGAPVLASERGREYFVSAESLKNPYIANLTRMIDNVSISGGKVPQFFEGGYNSSKGNITPADAGGASLNNLTTAVLAMERAVYTLSQIVSSGITAVIPDRTIIDAKDRFKKINDASGHFYE